MYILFFTDKLYSLSIIKTILIIQKTFQIFRQYFWGFRVNVISRR